MKTILVIDDEQIVRELLTEILTDEGFEVLTAKDGFEGFHTYEKHSDKIDCVILNIIMPGLHGHDCFLSIIANFPDARIILLTGLPKDASIPDMLNKGALAILEKPCPNDKIVEEVKKAVDAPQND